MKISQYFPKAYSIFGENIKVGLDLSNYAAKADGKQAAGVDTMTFVNKSWLRQLKLRYR